MNQVAQNQQTITVQNRTSDCEKLFNFLLAYAKSMRIPDAVYHDLRLIVEETFVNIASYAFEKDIAQTVTVELNINNKEIHVTFTDSGIAFNPVTHCNRKIEKDDHCDGGMGIHIIKSLSDNLRYDRISHRNVFTVTKHYTKQQ